MTTHQFYHISLERQRFRSLAGRILIIGIEQLGNFFPAPSHLLVDIKRARILKNLGHGNQADEIAAVGFDRHISNIAPIHLRKDVADERPMRGILLGCGISLAFWLGILIFVL